MAEAATPPPQTAGPGLVGRRAPSPLGGALGSGVLASVLQPKGTAAWPQPVTTTPRRAPPAGATPSRVHAGPPSPSMLTPLKMAQHPASAAEEKDGPIPPVKNTFIHYQSPVRTLRTMSPPRTVPSNFAPRQSLWSRLRSPTGGLWEMRTPIREGGDTPTTFEPETPLDDRHMAMPTPSTVGGPHSFPTMRDPLSFHMGSSVAGGLGLPGGFAAPPPQMFAQPYPCPCALPPVLPQPHGEPTPPGPPGTIVRLSEFLPSPMLALGGGGAGAVQHIAQQGMQPGCSAVSMAAPAAHGQPMAQCQQFCWMQGYDAAVSSMLPLVPPMPGHGPGMSAGCSSFDATVVATAAAAAAVAAAAAQGNFMDPSAAATAAAAAATSMLSNRLWYDTSAMQYCDHEQAYAYAYHQPELPRVCVSVSHFPEPSATQLARATTTTTTTTSSSAPQAASPTKSVTQPQQPQQQQPPGSPKAKIEQTPQRKTGTDFEAASEPHEEPSPCGEEPRRAVAARPRRRRGGHGRGGGGGGGGGGVAATVDASQ